MARAELTIIRMHVNDVDSFTITNREVMPQVDVFFPVNGELFECVESVLVANGIAHNVTALLVVRHCCNSVDYKVVYNMTEQAEADAKINKVLALFHKDNGLEDCAERLMCSFTSEQAFVDSLERIGEDGYSLVNMDRFDGGKFANVLTDEQVKAIAESDRAVSWWYSKPDTKTIVKNPYHA